MVFPELTIVIKTECSVAVAAIVMRVVLAEGELHGQAAGPDVQVEVVHKKVDDRDAERDP